jgi:hypothetical protein
VTDCAGCLPAADEAASSSGRSGNTYLDPVDGFSLSVPAGWASGEGVLDGNTSFGGEAATPTLRTQRDCDTTSAVLVAGASTRPMLSAVVQAGRQPGAVGGLI